MKKTLQFILMCLFVMVGTQAQTVKNEDAQESQKKNLIFTVLLVTM